MQTAPSTQSTARKTAPASTCKPRVALTGQRGTYRVESQTTPGVYYTTTAASCTCPARKPCKHMAAVKRLNVAFYLPKTRTTPAAVVASGNAALDEAERRLVSAHRALADTHPQADEYAVLLRQVDQAERLVAARASSAIQAA